MKRILLIMSATMLIPSAGFAKGMKLSGMGGESKPIEVKGQSRNISMLQTTQGHNENINFVKRRTNFRSEIKSTNF